MKILEDYTILVTFHGQTEASYGNVTSTVDLKVMRSPIESIVIAMVVVAVEACSIATIPEAEELWATCDRMFGKDDEGTATLRRAIDVAKQIEKDLHG